MNIIINFYFYIFTPKLIENILFKLTKFLNIWDGCSISSYKGSLLKIKIIK